MRILTLLTTTALIGFASAAFAADKQASANTQHFIEAAANGSEFEVASSKLALQKSQNPAVQQFAKQMISDHNKAAKDLKTYVDEAQLNDELIPAKLDSKHAAILSQLSTSAGSEFDARYIAAQKDAHREAVTAFDEYAGGGDNREIKDYAIKTLPTLKQHQAHVEKLK